MLDTAIKTQDRLMREGCEKWIWHQVENKRNSLSFIMKVGDSDFIYTILNENFAQCTTGIGKVWFPTEKPDTILAKLLSFYKSQLI